MGARVVILIILAATGVNPAAATFNSSRYHARSSQPQQPQQPQQPLGLYYSPSPAQTVYPQFYAQPSQQQQEYVYINGQPYAIVKKTASYIPNFNAVTQPLHPTVWSSPLPVLYSQGYLNHQPLNGGSPAVPAALSQESSSAGVKTSGSSPSIEEASAPGTSAAAQAAAGAAIEAATKAVAEAAAATAATAATEAAAAAAATAAAEDASVVSKTTIAVQPSVPAPSAPIPPVGASESSSLNANQPGLRINFNPAPASAVPAPSTTTTSMTFDGQPITVRRTITTYSERLPPMVLSWPMKVTFSSGTGNSPVVDGTSTTRLIQLPAASGAPAVAPNSYYFMPPAGATGAGTSVKLIQQPAAPAAPVGTFFTPSYAPGPAAAPYSSPAIEEALRGFQQALSQPPVATFYVPGGAAADRQHALPAGTPLQGSFVSSIPTRVTYLPSTAQYASQTLPLSTSSSASSTVNTIGTVPLTGSAKYDFKAQGMTRLDRPFKPTTYEGPVAGSPKPFDGESLVASISTERLAERMSEPQAQLQAQFQAQPQAQLQAHLQDQPQAHARAQPPQDPDTFPVRGDAAVASPPSAWNQATAPAGPPAHLGSGSSGLASGRSVYSQQFRDEDFLQPLEDARIGDYPLIPMPGFSPEQNRQGERFA